MFSGWLNVTSISFRGTRGSIVKNVILSFPDACGPYPKRFVGIKLGFSSVDIHNESLLPNTRSPLHRKHFLSNFTRLWFRGTF